MAKITNANAHKLVARRKTFQASNLSATWERLGSVYVVWSYGWYPIWVYSRKRWYRIDCGHNIITARHIGQTCPTGNYKLRTLAKLKEIIAKR